MSSYCIVEKKKPVKLLVLSKTNIQNKYGTNLILSYLLQLLKINQFKHCRFYHANQYHSPKYTKEYIKKNTFLSTRGDIIHK